MKLSWIYALVVFNFARADEVDTYIEAQMSGQHIPGAVLLVKKGDQIVKTASYGFSDLEAKKKMSLDRQLDMGSIGKSFTATLAMQLVEEKKLDLDASVRTYLPDVPQSWGDIRIRNLISHTSGAPEYALLAGVGLNDSPTLEAWKKIVYAEKSDAEPGLMFQYSNTNFRLLGEVIEKVTGKSYVRNLEERIYKKAGMRMEFRGQDKLARRTKGYFWEENKFVDMGEGGSAPIPSDGGGFITAKDLMKFATALQEGKLLKPNTLAMMQSPFVLRNGRKAAYGYGWFVRKVEGNPVVSHGGNSVGFSASLSMFPKQDLTVVFLSNVYPVSGDEIALGVARVLAPELRPKKLPSHDDPKPERTASVLKAMHELAAGNVAYEGFHPDMRARLATGRGKMALPAFAIYKDTKSLQFIDERREEPDLVVRYRAAAGTSSWILEFTIDSAGKVFSIGRSADPGQ